MPESIYNPQAPYYYLEVTNEEMETVLLNNEIIHPILQMLGYPEFSEIPQHIKDQRGITDSIRFKHVAMAKKELLNGNWGTSIQITPYINFLHPSTAVNHRLTSEQFDLALQYFGVAEFLTKDEYLVLESINIE